MRIKQSCDMVRFLIFSPSLASVACIGGETMGDLNVRSRWWGCHHTVFSSRDEIILSSKAGMSGNVKLLSLWLFLFELIQPKPKKRFIFDWMNSTEGEKWECGVKWDDMLQRFHYNLVTAIVWSPLNSQMNCSAGGLQSGGVSLPSSLSAVLLLPIKDWMQYIKV